MRLLGWRPLLVVSVWPLTALLVGCSDAESLDPSPDPDAGAPPPSEPALDPRFLKITLHRDFYCEGAAIADLDQDGAADVIAGPDWYAGPTFAERHGLWQRQPFDPKGYSDCFFEFAQDIDGDGWLDILVVGFPGEAAAWYQNPRERGAPWVSHEVVASVDNESPAFVDMNGDDAPELVFMNGGRLGWAGPDPAAPARAWTFHALSEDRGYKAFTHGLGVGDLDGDGRADALEASGYFLQPSDNSGSIWPRQDAAFGSGGAQMFAMDVDGDGDADVVTTLAAHGWGLAWFEQTAPGDFVQHDIVPGSAPPEGAEVIIHEPHALAVADIDGDGLSDLITGERFWGHVPEGDPDFGAPARLYWFRLDRSAAGPTFVPTLIDDDSGVGTQLTTGDVDGDGRTDIVVVNKKGAFVFVQTGG